jgi:hypothetical protein
VARFSATTRSDVVLAVPRERIWAALVDPELLPQLTPLLRRIEVDGPFWRWHLAGLSVLGVGITPVFTERMVFDHGRGIGYTHAPPPGVVEPAGAEGSYVLVDVPGGTHLAIELTLTVELPLTRLAAPAVRTVMTTTVQRIGERFGVNLLRHLGPGATAG